MVQDSDYGKIAFKKLTTGKSTTDLSGQYYNEPINSNISVNTKQIWTYPIPELVPSLINNIYKDANGNTILEYRINVVLAHIPGTIGSYRNENLFDIIPFNYGNPPTGTENYNYKLRYSTGGQIPFGLNNWYLDPDSGVLTFLDGNPAGVSAINPPKITCYQYKGAKGFPQQSDQITALKNLTDTSISLSIGNDEILMYDGSSGVNKWKNKNPGFVTQNVFTSSLSEKLNKNDNLSDLANITTARTNLGLGSLSTQSGTFSGTSSGTNTGNETLQSIGTLTNSASTKDDPADSDMVGLMDSASSNILKKISWNKIKTKLKSYFDSIYQTLLTYTPEDVNNKDDTSTLGTSSTKYPTQKAVKTYADTKAPLSSPFFTGVIDIQNASIKTLPAGATPTPVTITTNEMSKLSGVTANIQTQISNKQDSIAGKGLSTNDYTTEEKNKLSGLSNYTLPIASQTVLGGVKQGTNISIDGSGVISASQSSYTHPTQTAINSDNTGGTVIQDIVVNTLGHTTSINTYNLDNRYYTEAEVQDLLNYRLEIANNLSDLSNVPEARTNLGLGPLATLPSTTDLSLHSLGNIQIADLDNTHMLQYDTSISKWKNIPAPAGGGGGGAVSSVNGQTGAVVVRPSSTGFSGTLVEFNSALSDNDFASLSGNETLSNKTLDNSTITTTSVLNTRDDNFSITGKANNTKIIKFSTTNLPSNSSPTYYFPYVSAGATGVYLVDTNSNQTLNSKTLSSPVINNLQQISYAKNPANNLTNTGYQYYSLTGTGTFALYSATTPLTLGRFLYITSADSGVKTITGVQGGNITMSNYDFLTVFNNGTKWLKVSLTTNVMT